jgi:CMP-N,N'-diacetyllegionaminic acid synthase
MKIFCLIPARGGSKGIPKKNIKQIASKPLIYYTINAARAIVPDEDIIVSTDSKEIIDVVESYNLKVPFVRPAKLATDDATSEAVVEHAIDFVFSAGKSYDYLILLQPTSPLRTSEHIRQAIALIDEKTEMIVSVKTADANPYYTLFEEDESGILSPSKAGEFTRRQDCPKVYQLNGAVYIINIEKFRKKKFRELKKAKYVMDKRSSVDIDDPVDWAVAEYFLTEAQDEDRKDHTKT